MLDGPLKEFHANRLEDSKANPLEHSNAL